MSVCHGASAVLTVECAARAERVLLSSSTAWAASAGSVQLCPTSWPLTTVALGDSVSQCLRLLGREVGMEIVLAPSGGPGAAVMGVGHLGPAWHRAGAACALFCAGRVIMWQEGCLPGIQGTFIIIPLRWQFFIRSNFNIQETLDSVGRCFGCHNEEERVLLACQG